MAGLFTAQLDIIKIVHVVERPDADAAFAESFVGDAHVRLGHVVEVNLYRALGRVADDLDVVPCVDLPRRLVFIVGHRFARGIFHDHDLAAVRVRSRAEVAVIKMLGILPVEKHAAIAVVAGVLRAAHTERQHKIGDCDPLDQCDVVRAANLGLVIALPPVDPENVVAANLAVRPAFLVGDLPAFASLFKILLKNKGQLGGRIVRLAKLTERKNCGSQK